MITVFMGYQPQVKLLLSASFILTLGRAITLPFLVIYLASVFNLGMSSIGLLLGGALITGSLLSVYGGYLSDRLSSYWLLLAYAGLFTGGFVGMCVAGRLWLFFVFLVAFNFAYSSTDVVVKAALGRLLSAKEQSTAFSIRYTFINIAYAIGPFIGAGLSQIELKLPFTVSVLLGVLFACLHGRYGTPTQAPTPAGTSPVSFIAVGRVLLDDRRLVCFTVGGLLSAVVFGQYTAYLTQYLVTTRSAEVAYQLISTVVAVNAVGVVALQYSVGRRIHPDKLQGWLTVGLTLFLAGVVGFACSTTALQWSLAMLVFTLGEVIVFPAEYMFIDRIAPTHLRGMYYGAQNLAHLGGAFGPIFCGWMLAVAPAPWMFALLGAFIVLGGVLYRLGSRLAGPADPG